MNGQSVTVFLTVTFGTLGILAALLSIISNHKDLFRSVLDYQTSTTLHIRMRYHILFFLLVAIVFSFLGLITIYGPWGNFLWKSVIEDSILLWMMVFLYLCAKLVYLILRPW